MIRTDKWQQFATTQMAIYEPKTPPYGIGALHDMQHEAAHAATEVGQEWEPMNWRESLGFWLAVLGVPAAVIVVGLVVALS